MPISACVLWSGDVFGRRVFTAPGISRFKYGDATVASSTVTECSVQRRIRMLIAPAPNLAPSLREKMASAAVSLRKKKIHEPGTFEFLVLDKGVEDDRSAGSAQRTILFSLRPTLVCKEHTVPKKSQALICSRSDRSGLRILPI